MRNLLLGIDIGTSSCKVAVFDELGKVITAKNGKYNVLYPQPGYAEQNPLDWWEAIVKCIKEILTEVDPSEIKGIGIDGQSWSAIPVDKELNVLCNTPIWFDTRASEICNRVKAKYGENAFFEVSGNPFEPSYTLPKVMWYKENCPDIYEKMYKILQSNSFIVMQLTGKISQEYSQGYGLQCYDIKNRKWDLSVLEELEIRTDILPDFYECHEVVGGVTAKVAELTGLLEGTPVVAGGLDAACGTLGAGVINNGETQEQGGQAGGMSICTDQFVANEKLILSDHVVSGKWLLQGGTVGGGGTINWFEREFNQYERTLDNGKNSFEMLSEYASEIKPGSDGLIFLPYMAGERSPLWNPNAKGMYFGLDFTKTKGHFVRATMEGVAYSLQHNIELAENSGAKVDKLYAVGGSANSVVWTSLKADVTKKEIVLPYSDEATTLGAVILAGVGVGIYKDFKEAVEKTVRITGKYEPNVENYEVYEKGYKKYRALYENTKHLMEG